MNDTRYYVLFKATALVAITLCVAWVLRFNYDPIALARIDSTPVADYIAYERHLHEHSYLFHFFCFLVFGGFYIGVVDFIVYGLGLFTRRKAAS